MLKGMIVAVILAVSTYASDETNAMRSPMPEGAASAAVSPIAKVSPIPNTATSGTVGAGKPWRCQYTIAPNGGFPQFTICAVPAGYRFVIENISSLLQFSTSSRMDFFWIGTTLGGKQEVDFITYSQRVNTQYLTRMQTNQVVRLYADGGTDIKAAMQGSFNYPTDGLWVTLTGPLEAQ